MTRYTLRRAALTAVAALVAISLAPAGVCAQAEQGSQATTIAGTWTFDPYISDHAEQIEHALQRAIGVPDIDFMTDLSRQGAVVIEPGRGQRSGTAARPRPDEMGEADRRVFDALTDVVRFPPMTLAIAADNEHVSMTASGSAVTMATNGKSESETRGGRNVKRAAAWDGKTLIVTYQAGDIGTFRYSYSVAPTSGQLIIRFTFNGTTARWRSVDVKLIYNRRS